MGKLNAVRCDADFQQALEEVAKARGWSVPGLFREAARQYIQGDELHQAMVDLERRQAGNFKALHNEVRRMRNEMQKLMTMQELFIKSYYMHTPPIPEDEKPGAKAQALVRWEKLARGISDAGAVRNMEER
ncbi:hypothetical protein C8244_01830 [Paracidovorax avenae]|uniref:hypothetical protein n=1 Tax=Paracidovorax avenae TaxID=80867 RepID=UPI000D163550|nr:hypothetical protein [Paracidovorax avenae]AVS79988.1 hypothetical protein C8237_02000 [Paracidovorax avenae]AVT15087.1 hypothetical protein C8244_01830 [Paracidovorax avenae]